jgi:hypothetical protein
MNVPVDVRESFKKVCKLRNMNMSYVVVNFMKDYIVNEGDKIKNDLKKIKDIELMCNGVNEDRVKRKVENNRVSWFESSY